MEQATSNQQSAGKKPLSLEGRGKGEGGRQQSGPTPCIKPELNKLDTGYLMPVNISSLPTARS